MMADPTDVALVTGASGGIGLEIARLLAEDHRDLFLVARSSPRLEEVAQQLQNDHGVSVQFLAADLSRPETPGRIADAVAAQNLFVETLVNNAGFGLLGRFVQTDRSAQLEMIRLNVLALADLTHRFLGPMVERRRGGILNVASTAAFSPGPLMTGYYASKAFVLSFSEGLARELSGTGVSVTALCPGPVRTGFQRRAGIPPESIPSVTAVDARRVAKAGLDGLRAGKIVVVPGVLNRILTIAAQIAPRSMIREATFKVQSARLKE